jgi:hypothetical protein
MCQVTITIKIHCEEHSMAKGSAEYTIVVNPPVAAVVLTPGDPTNPTALADETVGVPITPVEIVASGGTGPYLFSISAGALPDGLQAVSDNVDTLQISGTPTTAGQSDFTITATDSTGAPAATSARFSQTVK